MTELPSAVLPKSLLESPEPAKRAIRVSAQVVEAATLEPAGVLARFRTRLEGLTTAEAAALLTEHGPNILQKDHRVSILTLLWHAVRNPLVLLLAVLATISFATRDPRAGSMMAAMIALSVGLRLVQEAKGDRAAEKLKAMISVMATVRRDGTARELPIVGLVPGDLVQLGAGDMIPGDVRIIEAKDLFVIQGSLTGESLPVEKHATEKSPPPELPLALCSVAFLGTSVESGSALAVVVATGKETYLGGMAESLGAGTGPRLPSPRTARACFRRAGSWRACSPRPSSSTSSAPTRSRFCRADPPWSWRS